MSKVRTEICIESNESFLVRRKRYSIRAWCDKCSRNSIFVLPMEAAFLAGLGVDKIVSLVCSNDLHVFNAPLKGAYVCLTSLCLMSQTTNTDESDVEMVCELPDLKDRELLLIEKEIS